MSMIFVFTGYAALIAKLGLAGLVPVVLHLAILSGGVALRRKAR